MSKKWFQDFKKNKSFLASSFFECRSHHSCPPKTKPNEGVVEEYDLKYTILSELISKRKAIALENGLQVIPKDVMRIFK